MPGATYTGVAANFAATSPAVITEPIDVDPQAAATYNVHDAEALTDAIEYFRQGLGVGGAVFGDGSDGVGTGDGIGALAGCALVGAVYTATRDLFFSKLVINNNVTLAMAGFRLYVNGELTLTGPNSLLHCNGGDGGTAGIGQAAGAGGGTNGILVGQAGGIGGTAANGNGAAPASPYTHALGATAGAGGAGGGGGGAGGAGASATAPGATAGSIHLPQSLGTGVLLGAGPAIVVTGGAGGGGGGADATKNGGGGGGGGGVLIIFARLINIINVPNPTYGIFARGGNAALADAGGNGGGGGGGGGGCVIVVYHLLVAGSHTVASVVVVNGGQNGGTGGGTGGAGANGTAGQSIVQII